MLVFRLPGRKRGKKRLSSRRFRRSDLLTLGPSLTYRAGTSFIGKKKKQGPRKIPFELLGYSLRILLDFCKVFDKFLWKFCWICLVRSLRRVQNFFASLETHLFQLFYRIEPKNRHLALRFVRFRNSFGFSPSDRLLQLSLIKFYIREVKRPVDYTR